MNVVQSIVVSSPTIPPIEEDFSDSPGDEEEPTSRKTCIKDNGDKFYHVKFMYVATLFYFLAVGLSSVALIFLINDRIAGDASDPNSKSIFVQTTGVFLNNASSFLCLRYNSGMGDFLGRRPVICFSTVALIVTRLLYSRAYLPAHFFVIAIISGATESFYVSTIAWVCDIFPNHAERSKQYGIFAGIAGFAAVVVGAPIGAAMSIAISPTAPFLASTLFSFVSFFVTFWNPCCDTLTLKSMETSEYRMISTSRALPKNLLHFLFLHFPIAKSSIRICLESKKTLDWVTFSIAQWTWAVLLLIIVQFLLKVFDWSRALSSLCLLSMGLSLGLFVPFLQNHFEPISLSFYSMGVQAVGYFLLCIAGTGVDGYIKLGVVGLTLIALGLAWLPCSQSIIMSGYEFGKQGVVSGLLGQMNDIAVLPAYLISLSFTFNLKRGSGHVYWPGCAFGICSIILLAAMCLHHYAHGTTVLTLKHRSHFKDGGDAEMPKTIRDVEFSKLPTSTQKIDVDEGDSISAVPE